MPQDATCTKCKHIFPVTESRNAFTVPCPQCEADLTIEFKKPATAPEAGQPPYELLVKPGALPNSAPAPTGPRKRGDDDDDEPTRSGGSALIVLLSGGLGLFFVLGGLSLTGWYLFTQIDMEDTASNRSSNNSNRSGNNTGGNNNRGNTNTGGNNNNNRPNPNPVPPPKRKDTTFDIRPATGTLPTITPPAALPASSTIDLGGKVGAVTTGGGGRYLIMHLPDRGQLMLFDASTAKTSVVEADRGNLLLAGGRTRLVAYVPSSKIARVYSLPNLAKQFDTGLQSVFDLRSIAMGNRTDGPLLGCDPFGEVYLYNLTGNGLDEIEAARGKPGIHGGQLRAAPSGDAFLSFDQPTSQSIKLLTEVSKRWRVQELGPTPYPGADGNFYGNGVVLDRSNRDARFGGVGMGSNTWYVPDVNSGNYFLKIAPTTVGKRPRETRTFTVTVHPARSANTPVSGTPTFTNLPDFENLADRWNPRPAVTLDQHFFLIYQAKLLVILSHGRDKLYLRRLDTKE